MKTISLLKAVLSQDMNLFQYKSKNNSSKFSKMILPIFLFFVMSICMGSYGFLLADSLAPLKLTKVILSLYLGIVTMLTFIEGIYKSQGVLFNSRDNDLLFSLPIKRKTIIFVRIFKLLLFELIYNMMFLLPAFFIYAVYEKPGISFYLLSFIMMLLVPIIPTIVSCFIGYFIKLVSSKFKSSKIVQTIFTSLIFIVIMFGSINMNSLLTKVTNNAVNINSFITKLYYPIELYLKLIDKFEIITFIKLIVVNLLPFVLFILFAQKFYFKIISNSKNNRQRSKKFSENEIMINKPINSLTKKEIKRYFSSPVYMFNTSFGLIVLPLLSLILVFKGKETIVTLLSSYGLTNAISIESLFYGLILFSILFTSITSSSISLEGRTINITKSLPIDYKLLFKSKIRTCLIIELPFVFISLLIYGLFVDINILFLIECLLVSIFSVLLNSVIGLVMNLKYPKLNATNDSEVVKQSMSSTVSVFIGMGLFFGSLLFVNVLGNRINIDIARLLHIGLLFISTLIIYNNLMKNGPKEYQNLNV